MKSYNVGILGNCCTHGAGICNMLNQREDTNVVAAYEGNSRRAKELQSVFGRQLSSSYQEVMNNPDLDFVAVTCDPCDKANIVEQATTKGLHILLNKPLCDSLENAHRIMTAVKTNGVCFVYDIPMVRLIPAFAKLINQVNTGVHGKIMGYYHLFAMNFPMDFDLKTTWPERLDPPEKSGGGEMTNMGCYAIDYAVSLFGKPVNITAKWRKTWDIYQADDVENFGQIILDYNDFFAFLDVGKQQLKKEHKHSNLITINFEHKTITIDANAQAIIINHLIQDYEEFIQDAVVINSVEQLINAIEHDTYPSSNIENAVAATEILMATYQSIIEKQPVTLPLTSDKNPLVS